MECGEVQIEQKDKSCTFHSAALRSNTFSKYSETSVDKLPTIENNFHRSLVPTSPVILYCSKKWSTILVTKWIIIERFHCTYLVPTMSHTHKHQLSVNQWAHLKLYYATLRISCLLLTSNNTYPTCTLHYSTGHKALNILAYLTSCTFKLHENYPASKLK